MFEVRKDGLVLLVLESLPFEFVQYRILFLLLVHRGKSGLHQHINLSG